MDGFRFRRGKTSRSSQSSGLTVVESSELARREEAASPDYPTTESMSTEWTDEKHSLYLKSMEASFVNQLYDSVDSIGWQLQNEKLPDPKSSRKKHFNTRTPSGKFKVLRGGCWKINYEGAENELDKADGDHMLLANPWIQRFRSACRRQAVESLTLQEGGASISQETNLRGEKALSCGLATSSKNFCDYHSHLCHQDSIGSKTEVSDQNFIGEEIEGEKPRPSHICSSKKMTMLITDTSSNDQVVPHGKSHVTEGATKKNRASSAR